MTDNPAMKRALIMQSFAPLFLILLIKYFDLKLFYLCKKFSDVVLNNPIYALTKVVNHSAFVTLILELFCLLWIIYSIYSARKFEKSQRADFVSEGESLQGMGTRWAFFNSQISELFAPIFRSSIFELMAYFLRLKT